MTNAIRTFALVGFGAAATSGARIDSSSERGPTNWPRDMTEMASRAVCPSPIGTAWAIATALSASGAVASTASKLDSTARAASAPLHS